jgi:Ca2+-binding RTX toxin-like protein
MEDSGGNGDDILFGEDGNDTLWAGAAYSGTFFGDRLHGGAGADYLGVGPLQAGQTAFVSMDGGIGDDILDGRTATGTIMFGGGGNDTILGSQTSIDGAWDAFNGGDGDDVVYGGLGYSN